MMYDFQNPEDLEQFELDRTREFFEVIFVSLGWCAWEWWSICGERRRSPAGSVKRAA